MKAFWNDRGSGPDAEAAVDVDYDRACRIWSDEVRGVEGDFFGLIDDQGRTIQFYHESGIPDWVDDAGHLEVLMDFPVPDQEGSYSTHVKIRDVYGLIRKAFEMGTDYRHFGQLHFARW